MGSGILQLLLAFSQPEGNRFQHRARSRPRKRRQGMRARCLHTTHVRALRYEMPSLKTHGEAPQHNKYPFDNKNIACCFRVVTSSACARPCSPRRATAWRKLVITSLCPTLPANTGMGLTGRLQNNLVNPRGSPSAAQTLQSDTQNETSGSCFYGSLVDLALLDFLFTNPASAAIARREGGCLKP